MSENFAAGFSSRYQPLKKDDSVYAPCTDRMMNACLSWAHDPTHAYVTGFLELAEIGIAHVDETRSGQDTLVYPITYLYRHHLELLMKDIINDGYELLERENRPPRGHRLLQLWFECKSIAKEVWPEESSDELIHAERIIKELAQLDPEGESFRYPRSKDGSLALQTNRRTLSLLSISNAVRKVSQFLGGVNAALSEYVSWKREAEAEMRSELQSDYY